MKTDYVFGDRVKVLPKLDETTEYSDRVKDGDIGFVLNNNGSTFPVEVQFVGYSEVFMYEELEFLKGTMSETIKGMEKVQYKWYDIFRKVLTKTMIKQNKVILEILKK